MSKKIIAVSILMLVIIVLFAACKKDEYQGNTDNPTITTDEDGRNFITNIYGDEIEVTTDENGFYDDISTLITQTTSSKKDEETTNKKDDSTSSTTTTTTTTSSDGQNSSTTTTEKNEIVIGTSLPQDSVSWDDIVNAGKK